MKFSQQSQKILSNHSLFVNKCVNFVFHCTGKRILGYSMQTTSHILMVRPAHFGFNEETASSNAFQSGETTLSREAISRKALEEFDQFVSVLRAAGVEVTVADDSPEPVKPDAVFPNNWMTLHDDGTMILYPMQAAVRRLERQSHIIEWMEKNGQINQVIHLEGSEKTGHFLEGTGSMILDRDHRIVYACLSPRTDAALLDRFCQLTGYEAVTFHSTDANGQDIYHTNVMMALGDTFAVICTDTIRDTLEREKVELSLRHTGKEIIAITLDQMLQFAGNMLQVCNREGDTFLVMSEQAYLSLLPEQLVQINRHTRPLYSPLYTIEKFGGGSARCMMAENFLPRRQTT